MDRQTLLQLWNEAETKGLWHAPWSKSLSGLTPAEAAWKPSPQRHSIWQIVNHMIFWREHELRNLVGKKPDESEINRRNWEEPNSPTDGAWSATLARFAETHRQIAEAIANEKNSIERLCYLMPHDSYHVGQAMYVRALQGLPPIE